MVINLMNKRLKNRSGLFFFLFIRFEFCGFDSQVVFSRRFLLLLWLWRSLFPAFAPSNSLVRSKDYVQVDHYPLLLTKKSPKSVKKGVCVSV